MSMLTVNADDHPLMRNFHRPEDEKRMAVILEEADFDAWLAPSRRPPFSMVECFDAAGLVADGK
jgi:putative SOS response-associated peptidase YedK